MDWTIEFSAEAQKQLKKINKADATKIQKYIVERISKNPYSFGEDLKHNLSGLRRYRVQDYRIICEIHDTIIKITIISIDHRSKVYKNIKL